MRRVAALLALAWIGLAGCTGSGEVTETGGGVDPEVMEIAINVLTLQRGTMSELRDQRGKGPFTTFERSPEEMLDVIERAARKARGLGDEPVRAIFASPDRGEVVAKERTAEEAQSDGYAAPFRSAMLAVVHPIRGEPNRSRVEIHAIQRGPFHQGAVNWQQDMPRWINEALADDQERPADIAPIR